jgi:hypothetical protein
MTKWGIVTTVKAPLGEIADFAAYHLDLGAHRIFIYLDDPDPTTRNALNSHPKIRVKGCNAAYWAGQRPKKHQARQTFNATHAYNRDTQVDWLAHIDVDEFLVPEGDVGDHLSSLPDHIATARIRPMERLAGGDGTAYKASRLGRAERHKDAQALYPTFGPKLRDGFLSHVAGKVFFRTGRLGVGFRIHNVFELLDQNPGQVELDSIMLAHHHAATWNSWRAHFLYRLEQGAYRPELDKSEDGLGLNQLLGHLFETEGDTGLRRFFDEVCADTPALRDRLAALDLLRLHNLNLPAKRAKHFPELA